MILRREVPAQQAHGGERYFSRGEQIEDHRKAPAGPSGFDAITRGVFRESKGLGAIAEQGYAEFRIMRSSPLDSGSSRVGYSA